MPIPTSYTEKTLAEYMHTMLGKTARALSLQLSPDGAGDYAEAVIDALLLYGAENIASITGMANIQKLRALAKVAAWRHVVNNFAALYDFSADGGNYHRGQLFENAQAALKAAERQALSFDPNYSIRIRKVDHVHDPYTVRDLEDRPL